MNTQRTGNSPGMGTGEEVPRAEQEAPGEPGGQGMGGCLYNGSKYGRKVKREGKLGSALNSLNCWTQ